MYSLADVHVGSCGHHGRVVVVIILPSSLRGVHLEDELHITCKCIILLYKCTTLVDPRILTDVESVTVA